MESTKGEVVTVRVKPGSKPYRDQLRTRLIAVGFPDAQLVEQVAADLISRCQKRPREAWRLAAELSLDEAAARYNTIRTARGAPMRQARVWDYEQWPRAGARPTVRALKILAQVYGTTWDRLVDLEDLTHMNEQDREAYHAVTAARRRGAAMVASTPVAASTALEPGEDGADAAEADAAGAEDVIEEAAEQSAQLATWAGSTNVDDDLLDQLGRRIRGVAHAYVYYRPYPLLVRTCRIRNRVRTLLQGRQRPPQTRELYLAGARACTLRTWIQRSVGERRTDRDCAAGSSQERSLRRRASRPGTGSLPTTGGWCAQPPSAL